LGFSTSPKRRAGSFACGKQHDKSLARFKFWRIWPACPRCWHDVAGYFGRNPCDANPQRRKQRMA
jgi:hypothetical protein